MNRVNQAAFAVNGNTVSLAATNATGNVQVQSASNSAHVRVYNSGNVTVFLAFGTTNAVTASASTGLPIPAGAVEVLSCPFPYVAGITASGTATIYFTPGEGL